MKLGEKPIVRLCFLFVLISAVAICLYAGLAVDAYTPGTQPRDISFTTGWKSSEASLQDISFPLVGAVPMGSKLQMINTLPDNSQGRYYLYIKTNYQPLEVRFFEVGAVTKVLRHTVFSLSYSNPWAAVEIPEEAFGGSIAVSIISNGSKSNIEVYDVLLGSLNEVNGVLISRSIPMLCLFIMLVFFAAYNLFTALSLKQRGIVNSIFRYSFLSIFAIFSAGWILLDCDIAAVLFINRPEFLFCNMFIYMLMPIPFLLFLSYEVKGYTEYILVLFFAQAVNFLVTIALILLGLFSLSTTLSVTHLLLSATMASFIPIAIIDYKNERNRASLVMIIALIILCISGFVEMLSFYFWHSPYNTLFYGVGLLLFCSILSINMAVDGHKAIKISRMLNSFSTSIPSGLVHMDSAFNIIYANDVFYRMFAKRSKTGAKDSFKSYIDDASFSAMTKNLGIEDSVGNFSLELCAVNGKYFIADFGRNDSGAITVILIDDTSESRRMRKRVNAGISQRREAYSASKQDFRYDLADDVAYLSKEAARVLGVPDTIISLPESIIAQGIIAPESVEDYRCFYAQMRSGKQYGSATIRRAMPSGVTSLLVYNYSLLYDGDKPVSAYITFEEKRGLQPDEK